MIVTAFAPAKVNLYLHVGRPLPDGMHPLDSLVAFASDVGDWVSAGPSAELTLDISGPYAAELADQPFADNLVVRAAQALAAAAGVPAYASLHLEKTLPIASGIGGGSADAAAALRVLNRLWAIGAGEEDLERLAASLGADVAACVRSRACRMNGTGATVTPASMAPLWCVLVNPGAPSPTRAVYAGFDELGLGHAFRQQLSLAPLSSGDAGEIRAWLDTASRNDLERPALKAAPAIGDVLERLQVHAPTALRRLSGSGATCFALVESASAALRLAETLQADRPTWWVRATSLGDVDVDPSGG